jgi:hypothetical protein
MRRALLLSSLVVALTGCAVPGIGTVIEKTFAELRGGHGEARPITPLPDGPSLDRFRRVRVARVERSADAGPMPDTLPDVVEGELRDALSGSGLFPGDKGPILLVRARLTTHWQAAGVAQAVNAHSEILARVEFVEEGRRTPLGVYYVRGMSTALARRSDGELGRGLASAVVEVIESRRTPPERPVERPGATAER